MSFFTLQKKKEILPEAEFDLRDFKGVEEESISSIAQRAEGFHLKGLHHLAAKLFITSSTYDTQGTPFEQRYRECVEPKEFTSIEYDEDEKFDFLCVPSGNTGSSVVSHIFSWHPQIAVQPKAEADQAIHDKCLSGLMNRSIPFRKMSGHHRHGIVQHNYIVGNHRLLSQDQWSIELSNLRKVVRGDRFYQIVRDPFDSARSRFRRQTMARITQQWREASGQINFVPRMKLSDVPNMPMKFNIENNADCFNSDEMKQSFFTQESMGLIDQYQIGTEYQKAFSDWKVFDVGDFSINKVQNTLSHMYSGIGVDNRFDLPLLKTPQNTNINRIMYSSWISVKHQGYEISLGLYFADLATFSMDFPFIELAWRDPCQEWLDEGLPDHRLALTCNYQFWANLPLKTRQLLFKSGELHKVLDNLLYPAILSIAKKTSELSKHIYDYIDNEHMDWLANEFIEKQRSSIDPLIDKHPHLARKWQRYANRFM